MALCALYGEGDVVLLSCVLVGGRTCRAWLQGGAMWNDGMGCLWLEKVGRLLG